MKRAPPDKPHKKGMRTPQVSNLGRFRCCRGIAKTPIPNKNGYSDIKIANKTCSLHRTIAITFGLPRGPGQYTVNHKTRISDGGTNALDNLEWASQAEQIRHSIATNPDRKSNAAQLSKPVYGRKAGTDDEWIRYNNSCDVLSHVCNTNLFFFFG